MRIIAEIESELRDHSKPCEHGYTKGHWNSWAPNVPVRNPHSDEHVWCHGGEPYITHTGGKMTETLNVGKHHHHHFYNENDHPSILAHDHSYDDISHTQGRFPADCTVYWDHSGYDCFAETFEEESG